MGECRIPLRVLTSVLDLAIVNGTVVDGTGSEPLQADIGISDGRVVTIKPWGTLSQAARRIDASGMIVTPGFVDPHTHMDAQLWWDPSGVPSVLHGVTSIAIGSCGFGVAPCRPGTEDYVLRSLESVEEIPYEATRSGVPMKWGSWLEFFEGLGTLDLGVNVAGFVPHSALRAAILSDDSRSAPASPAERRLMVDALEEALDGGAVGLSSSKGSNHVDGNGRPVPSRAADAEEYEDLVGACAGRIWQINLRAKADASDRGIRAALDELDTYLAWSEAADATLTWTPLVAPPGDDRAWRALLSYTEGNASRLKAQTSAQAISAAIRFDGASQAALIDGWGEPFAGYGGLSPRQRRDVVADREFRAALKASPPDPARSTSPCYDRWRFLISPSCPECVGSTISSYAEQLGSHPVDAMCDLALADDLRTVIEAPLSNTDEDAVRALSTSDATIFGIGDAGAHVTSITNYTYPTHVLASMVRDKGWMSLPKAVWRLCAQPASVLHLRERGVIAEGKPADLCVIDLEHLGVGPAELVSDLPAGARRAHRAANGYRAVIVNGVITVEYDALTSARAGELIRV